MFLASVAWVALAAAGPADLRAAERAFQGARFEEARGLAESALTGLLSDAERVRAYELLAFAHAAFNDEVEQAVDAFAQALRLAPDYDPGSRVSPKVRALFEQARLRVPRPPPQPAPALTPAAVPSAGAAAPRPHTERGLLHRWWFWSGVAAVVVAGTVTAVALTASGPSGTLGAGKLP
jgi:hypothetical protein